MSDLSQEQLIALSDAYTTLGAIYNVYKNDERAILAVHAAQSMALLTGAFPEIALLEEIIAKEPTP